MCKLSTFRAAFQEHVVISSHIIKMKGKCSLRSFRAPGRRRRRKRDYLFKVVDFDHFLPQVEKQD